MDRGRSRPTSQAMAGGTTVQDESAGNTSLGFHESCHREDFLTYLKTKPLPTFGGRAGITEQQYHLEAQKFGRAFQKYFGDMEAYSHAQSDEVGYKKVDL